MSIFGALSTAVSGLSAQSHAFTDISNNISNSQTVGYKATDTDFSDYVLTSGDAQGTNGTVRATTSSQNEAQGTITSTSNALALAISGRGFFSVAEESGNSTTTSKVFQNTAYYTRNGDFTENNLGYLVNSSNEYLKGYQVDSSTGALNTSSLQAINVANVTFRPVATTTVTAAATLPSASVEEGTGTATAGATTQTTSVLDSTGASQPLNLTRSYNGAGTATGSSSWTLNAAVTDGGSTSATVDFDSSGNLLSVTPTDTSVAATTTAGSTASLTIPSSGNFGAIAVNFGTIGSSTGSTMATGTGTGAIGSASADGAATGVYQGITMTADGNIMANFDNDQTQLVGKVPLATFADSNALLAHDGQAYTATTESGAATVNLAGENGAGDLETSSIENSTTSLDTDLTKLITAQQAYGANAKVVTTADQMLQTVLSLKQ